MTVDEAPQIAGGDEVVGQAPGLGRLDLAAALPQLRRDVRQAEVAVEILLAGGGHARAGRRRGETLGAELEPALAGHTREAAQVVGRAGGVEQRAGIAIRFHDAQLDRDAVGEDRRAAPRRPARDGSHEGRRQRVADDGPRRRRRRHEDQPVHRFGAAPERARDLRADYAGCRAQMRRERLGERQGAVEAEPDVNRIVRGPGSDRGGGAPSSPPCP